MEFMLDLQLPDVYLKGVAMMTWYRVQGAPGFVRWRENPRNLQRGCHMAVCQDLASNVPVLGMVGDRVPTERALYSAVCVNIPSREAWSRGEPIAGGGTRGDIEVFTDGSRKEGRTGASFCLRTENGFQRENIPLGLYPTVFQAEVVAIEAACTSLCTSGTTNKSIRVLSDSQAALKALCNTRITSKGVASCKQAVERLVIGGNRVSLIWIPGHEGHEGNEVADQAAKMAAEADFLGPEPALPISLSVCKSGVREWCRREHKRVWENRTDCRQSKNSMDEPSKSRRVKFCKLSRGILRQVLGVLTGHCALNRHLHLMGKVAQPTCTKCGEEEETVTHYLGRCPVFFLKRMEAWGSPVMSYEDIKSSGTRPLIKFLRSTQRLLEWSD